MSLATVFVAALCIVTFSTYPRVNTILDLYALLIRSRGVENYTDIRSMFYACLDPPVCIY
jgi:hypothetical protein